MPCVGRGDPPACAWYGILLDRGDSRIFLARHNPKPPKTRDPDAYYAVGKNLAMPVRADWRPNIGVSDIETILMLSVGISENVTAVPEDQTRNPIAANIRHALMFCIQDQDEIDSRKILFHRQSEPFLPQAIKDVLPYFSARSTRTCCGARSSSTLSARI